MSKTWKKIRVIASNQLMLSEHVASPQTPKVNGTSESITCAYFLGLQDYVRENETT